MAGRTWPTIRFRTEASWTRALPSRIWRPACGPAMLPRSKRIYQRFAQRLIALALRTSG